MTLSAAAQWKRWCNLVVGTGTGLDLSGLHIKFVTHKGDIETPNSAEITVYNLSPETAARLRGEFKRVVLSAGYETNNGIIFDGTIRQVRSLRSGADSWVEIIVADGDRAYNFATVNCTLAAGARPADQVAACATAMAAKGAATGYVPDLGGQDLPRGKVMYGMARSYMRDAATTTDTTWSIQDGKMQMVPAAAYLPGEAVILTASTGLIGSPEQTNEGIKVRCLLNPRIRIGGRIKLDNASIATAKVDLAVGAISKAAKLDSDGYYRVLKVEHIGDTHGTDWYCDLICIGLDDISRTPLDRI